MDGVVAIPGDFVGVSAHRLLTEHRFRLPGARMGVQIIRICAHGQPRRAVATCARRVCALPAGGCRRSPDESPGMAVVSAVSRCRARVVALRFGRCAR
jgi:hypothetical protein